MGNARVAVLAVSITFLVVASICIILRFYTRIAIVKNIGHHDYWCLVAWIVDFGFSFSLLYATSQGLGLPSEAIDSQHRGNIVRATYAFIVLHNPALMTVKTSFLIFYLSFSKGQRLFRLATYVTLFVVNVAGLVLTLLNIFQCRPVAAAFRSDLRSTAKMNLPRSQKIILTVLFGCGIFVTIIDVIRIIYLQRAVTDSEETFQLQIDSDTLVEISSNAALSMMWSVAEVNMAVICTCIPLLKPLVVRVLPMIIGDINKKHETSTHSMQFLEEPFPSLPSPSDFFSSNRRSASSNGTFRQKRSTNDNDARFQAQRAFHGSTDMLEHVLSSELHPGRSTPLKEDLQLRPNTIITGAELSGALPVQPFPSNTNHDFVDFVQVNKPKSMLKLNNRESLFPLVIVTIIFFVWGFSYGLLGSLGDQIQTILELNSWQFLGNHAAYFGGYLLSPLLIGRWVLKKWGFKFTFITGLCLYACGTLVFWPSAVLLSYPAFVVSNLVIGIGLGVLETASDSFVTLCGPPENAEIRLTFVQSIQAVASVVSPLLAQKVLFRSVTRATALVDPQWTYLSIAFFVLILAVVLYYLPLPEAPDEDLEELAKRDQDDYSTKVLGVPVIWMTLLLGVSSLFFYTAGQEILSTSFETLVSTTFPTPTITPFDYLTIGHSVFTAGRFLTALTVWFLKPRWVLMIGYLGAIVFSVLCMNTTGSTAVIMGLMIYVFESGIFSIIFAISLRCMGRHTKTAAPLLATAVGGGAFLPFAQYGVSVSHRVPYSYCVLLAVFCAGAIFPLYLNFVPAARRQVDPVPSRFLRHRRALSAALHRAKPASASGGVGPGSPGTHGKSQKDPVDS
ncbi:MFS general substrate transporter [Aspergillus ellipticus CBS 707.79]|uniref:MFS general substrate transporter n=1 Tax=Aspergillus ellipticus CBS 707.79 TaxID=1448320 RepID=A0A319DK29_9EURO|nr:MFS general substrate transporter [Aspergillus ellipticus CBS 707.79]